MIVAGGCFWCMEKPFEKLDGVKKVESGYSGGHVKNPNYKQVSSGKTGHLEVVRITYDSKKISFFQLLKTYWQQVNPTDAGGQFVDRGKHYSTAIYYSDNSEKELAENFKKKLNDLKIYKKDVITPILKIQPFYLAEEYHQDYYKKNPVRYWYYRNGSGRDKYLESVWTEKNKSKYDKAFPDNRTKTEVSDSIPKKS